MKKLVQVTEVEGEGLLSLMGQRITLFCLNYIYTGDLVGVNEQFVKLDNPAIAYIAYETNPFTDNRWKDAECLPNSAYVMLSCIESFTVLKV